MILGVCGSLISSALAQNLPPDGETNVTGWSLQDATVATESGEIISSHAYKTAGWINAVVPGTVLTSLVKAGKYPEPLYGENNRNIPESLCRTSYWYRTTIPIGPLAPRGFTHAWLNFYGINYAAEVWANGHRLGQMKGAFTRGSFDIFPVLLSRNTTSSVVIAVKILPPNHPGNPKEQTVALGTGLNGGAIGADGPTFNATVGWDWIPGIRDRDMGLWQCVGLRYTKDVLIEDPYVKTVLPLPKTDSAELTISTTLRNLADHAVETQLKCTVKGTPINFTDAFHLAAREVRTVQLTPKDHPVLRLAHPKLWWPNTYGQPDRYALEMTVVTMPARIEESSDGRSRKPGVQSSDARSVSFGVRSIQYFREGGKDLTVIVNGVPIFCKGGNWGMDEAMKRSPRSRLDAQLRLHRDANCTMVRNWVGQVTQEDFYDLCDKYGMLIWDDFWLANPVDGPIPEDPQNFLANAREKVLRFRNHPSVAVWCGRNEGNPPPVINDGLRTLVAELDGVRYYQPHSSATNGVGGGGPYSYHKPADYFKFRDALHTEIGGPSIPTMEAIKAMMPSKDWWPPLNDDWAMHDLCRGAQRGDDYVRMLGDRFGKVTGFADFERKAQLANYESYRGIFEGRAASLFAPATGVLLWMSNPSQPSFVWQLYSYDLEPTAALFGTQKGCEPIHVEYDEANRKVVVVNTTPRPLNDLKVRAVACDFAGRSLGKWVAYARVPKLSASAPLVLPIDKIDAPQGVFFLRLELLDSKFKVVSENFYWLTHPNAANDYTPGDFSGLQDLKPTRLDAHVSYSSAAHTQISVQVSNTGNQVALGVHLQLRRKKTGERILPTYYSDNYVSLLPSEAKTITLSFGSADLKGDTPEVCVDGWNISVDDHPAKNQPLPFDANLAMKVMERPVMRASVAAGEFSRQIAANPDGKLFRSDDNFVDGGNVRGIQPTVVLSMDGTNLGPEAIYRASRSGEVTFTIPVPPGETPYKIRLHFVDTQNSAAGARSFNVDLNGARVLTEFDIAKESGGRYHPIVKEFNDVRALVNGTITISLTRGLASFPTICAVEVVPLRAPNVARTPPSRITLRVRKA